MKISKDLLICILFILILLYIFIKYFVGMNPFIQENTIIYWILLISALKITLIYGKNKNISIKVFIFIGFYFLLFTILEIMDIFLSISLWNQTERTSVCYDWFEQYLIKDYDINKDYTEQYFNKKYDISINQANTQKYDYMFDKLQLKPGMKLLDMGCGIGTWMLYCKNKGVETVGLTLSEEQAKLVREKGIKVYVKDYRLEYTDFFNQFDRITILGSTEHNCSFTGIYDIFDYNKNIQKCNNLRTNLFKLCKNYLKENGKIFIAGLVLNNDYVFTNYDLLQVYILERHYGGRYSRFDDYKKSLTDADLKILDIKDATADYHYSSVADEDYFGCWKINWSENTFNKITYIFKGILSDPFLIHRWLYYAFDTWQWQFGTTCSHKKPLTDEEVKNISPCQNKWFLCGV